MLIEHVAFKSKAADAPLMLKEGIRAVDVEDFLSDLDNPLEDPYFQYHLLPFGFRHEVQVLCTAKGSAYAVLALSRKDSSGRFDERLFSLLNALAPHVAEGIARAAVREALASPQGTDIGMMVLDESGRVELANGVAETCLYSPLWPPGQRWGAKVSPMSHSWICHTLKLVLCIASTGSNGWVLTSVLTLSF